MLAPFLALATMQAFSPNSTDLQKQRRLYVTAMDGTRPLDIDESYQAGVCFGFIGGIAEGQTPVEEIVVGLDLGGLGAGERI